MNTYQNSYGIGGVQVFSSCRVEIFPCQEADKQLILLNQAFGGSTFNVFTPSLIINSLYLWTWQITVF